jgi:aspartyl-tRNA(Asn)/glutamyl-tRNA(Gln) amidotransferase subunit A
MGYTPNPRIAVPHGWGEDLDELSAEVWRKRTANLPRVAFPDRAELNEVGLTVLLAEAASFHRRWLETMPERYGADVREVLTRGLAISKTAYVMALLRMAKLRVDADRAMFDANIDALVVPATRVIAPLVGAPVNRPDLTGYTRPFNTTGQPSICLPATAEKPAVGIQIVGRHGEDWKLLGVAAAIEADWERV